MAADDGFEVAFHGEYREIVPDERIVSTEIYEIPDQGDAAAHGQHRHVHRDRRPDDARDARAVPRRSSAT